MPEVLIGGKNKTQIVKETLTELGFLTEKRPADWVNKTRQALLKKHVTVHETVIYQTRKAHALAQEKAAAVKNEEDAKRAAEEKNKKDKEAAATNGVLASLTLADAADIKAFAKKHGGFEKAKAALVAVEAFYSE